MGRTSSLSRHVFDGNSQRFTNIDVGLLIADKLNVPLTPPLRLYSQGRPLSDYKRVRYYCLGDQSRLGIYGGLLGGSNEYGDINIELENKLYASIGSGTIIEVTQDIVDIRKARQDARSPETKEQISTKRMIRHYAYSAAQKEQINRNREALYDALSPEKKDQINNCADNKKEKTAARKRQNSKARYEAMKLLPNARELMNAANENTNVEFENKISASFCSETITQVTQEHMDKGHRKDSYETHTVILLHFATSGAEMQHEETSTS